MVPLRASTTKSEWLPDDPTAFAPTKPWKSPFITTWADSRSQNHPTNSAEEAELSGGVPRDILSLCQQAFDKAQDCGRTLVQPSDVDSAFEALQITDPPSLTEAEAAVA